MKEREKERALPCRVNNYFGGRFEFQFYIFLPMLTPIMLRRSIIVEFSSKEKRYSRGSSEITYF